MESVFKNKTILLLNGPPGSGKDTLGAEFVKWNPEFQIVKFAQILKEATHSLYGMDHLKHDAFENTKDIPSTHFIGLTPRQAYIGVSENYFKKMHGNDIFGVMLAEKIKFDPGSHFIVTDSGFREEAEVLIKEFGAMNITLLRIHDRGSFDNDSRSFISLPILTIDLHNNGTEEEFLTTGCRALRASI